MKYCTHCGNELLDDAVICPKCGCAVANANGRNAAADQIVDPDCSEKSRGIACILAGLLGGLGIHRFYVGKIGTGVLWLLTFGCFGIGALVDFIMIICGNFKDKDGLTLKKWDLD